MLKIFFIIIFLFSSIIYSQDILYISSNNSYTALDYRINLVSKFYGISLNSVRINHEKDIEKLNDIIINNKYKAVIIHSDALTYISEKIISKINSPILIAEADPQNNTSIKILSNNIITGCSKIKDGSIKDILNFSDQKKITVQLANQVLPFEMINLFSFNIGNIVKYTSLLDYIDKKDIRYSLFGKASYRDIFFLVKMVAEKNVKINYRRDNFFEIAPLMIFLKYSLGDYIWHNPNYYANLTIDDPWLIKQYGYLNYQSLLKEMKNHNFHTTIAFIPWNYDRSKPEVISLFKENPDRFSLSFHGNNHDHREFGLYNDKSLTEQEEDIRQALARMCEFNKLTNIPFDSIMIFPHAIAPEKTLWLLKKYNFLATINGSNVPLGSSEPSDPFFYLKNITLEYENFPSLSRTYCKNIQYYTIPIDLFLGNPILFYCHHEDFKDGISSFNSTSDLVNDIQPDIKWANLANIVKHLYVEKFRDDGNYDIHTFSSNIILTNNKNQNLKFYITKYETNSPEIEMILIDNKQYPNIKISNDTLSIIVNIPKNETRNIAIKYKNDFNLSLVNISKDNFRVNLLRKVSDFRDFYLSTNSIGLAFTSNYYKTGFFKYGLNGLFYILIAGLIGTLLMDLFFKINSRSGLKNTAISSAIGFVFYPQLNNPYKFRILLHLIFGIFFAFLYLFIIILYDINGVLLSAVTGLLIGFFHGIIGGFIFVRIVSKLISVPSFREIKFSMMKIFWIGHLVYGLTVGFIISLINL